jgi:hypothetical protein
MRGCLQKCLQLSPRFGGGFGTIGTLTYAEYSPVSKVSITGNICPPSRVDPPPPYLLPPPPYVTMGGVPESGDNGDSRDYNTGIGLDKRFVT